MATKARSRWTPFWAIVAVLLVLGYLYLSVTEDSTTTAPRSRTAAAPAARAPAGSWTRVASWTGSGAKGTDTFETKSREWRIHWESAAGGILQVYVYRGDGEMLALPVNQLGGGKDISYVRTDPGPHYLDISGGPGAWSVTVEDKR